MEHSRDKERYPVSVEGRYRKGNGQTRDVPVLDLSETGCKFFDKFGRLETDTRVTIKIETIGPIGATVRWREKYVVGVEFEAPIYGPVMEHIRDKLSSNRQEHFSQSF